MDGNGVANVYDPGDAIPAAAGYLLAHGAPEDLLVEGDAPVVVLRCDAAAAFAAMDAAHRADRGGPIPVTDSYRDYAAQVALHRRKPHLAAAPGQPNDGWGLAVDVAASGWNGEVFAWLQANAHTYGWYHPPWARIDGSKPEPWHWEYAGIE